MNHRLHGLHVAEDGLELEWVANDSDGGPPSARVRVPWLWLRDHCQAPESVRLDTGQRQVDTFAIPSNIRGTSAAIVGEGVEVRWHGDPQVSRYSIPFLRDASFRPERIGEREIERQSWDAASVQTFRIDYGDLGHSGPDGTGDAGLARWLRAVARNGFALVDGVPPTAEATRELAERIGYLRQSIYGDFWVTEANLEHHDTGYTDEFLGSHTDGTYCHDAPGLLLFHVTSFDGAGGDSTLVDGLRIAERLRAEDPRAYQVLTSVEVPGQYLEPGVHLRAQRPVIRLDVDGEPVQVSYNNYDRAPFVPPAPLVGEFYRALGIFHELANDPAALWRHRLLPGTVLLFDNWRLLHGRYAYRGRRVLAGCYFNREDFESRLRVLA